MDYFADVWLNGCFLGSHEGFFNHFEFDASRWISQGGREPPGGEGGLAQRHQSEGPPHR